MRTLFKNGLLYDGSCDKPYNGDILIEDDIIINIGNDIESAADRIVDCTGLSITPGWIDAHSHNDFYYDRENAETYFEPFLRQGITTQITGNCGFSVFGVEQDSIYKKDVGGGLFHAVDSGSYAQFLQRAKGNLFVNMAPLIGHGTARISISGLSPRKLGSTEKERLEALVDEAMEGGAFGGSFGFMYEPGMYAPMDELVGFASAIARRDGILTVHPRACSKMSMDYPLISRPHIELALEEVLKIARASKVKTEYSHLIFVGRTSWKCADKMLDMFRKARAEDIDIAYDNYSLCYGASVITVICPAWYMALDASKKRSAWVKAKLRLMINLSRKLLGIDYGDITVAWISPDHPEYEGRTIDEIARSSNKDPLDIYLELIELSNGKGRVYLGKYYNEALIQRLMNDDLSVFMTDAWIEEAGIQNGAAYQCFPNFLVIAKETNMPLEKVINKMTGKTAERFGIPKRGFLRQGWFADLTIFDEQKLSVALDRAGSTPRGIMYTVVNGQFAVDNGKYRTQRAGMVLSKG